MPRTTVRIMGPDGLVPVEAIESGVPGLALALPPSSERWVLVHVPSGLAVSRAAKHHDPEVLVELASRLAPLADWSQAALAVPGPVLRREVDRALADSGLEAASRTTPGEPQGWSTERERDLLVTVLRRAHTAIAPGDFATVIEDLDAEERAQLRALLTDEPTTGAVLQSLPAGEAETSASSPLVSDAESGSAAS
jgi:hypothetical protein